MDNAAYKQFTTTAAQMTKTLVQGQVELFDMFAQTAKGTPVAPFFDAAAKMQRATLDGFDTLSQAIDKEPTKAEAKKAAKAAAEPFKATTKAMKKAVDAQAAMMIDAGAETVAATSKTKDAVAKAAGSAAKGDVAALYDDLTAMTGIGPSTMKKLNAEGIRTVADLAKTSSKDLGNILEKANVRILKYSPAEWIADAKGLMKAAKGK
jgi:predicted flap endonuclease-1-like 5' DNA nuclease